MSLTLITILATAWLVLLAAVWAVCAAAGRADARDDAAIATEATPASVPPMPVVVDSGRLTRQLEATAELVGASKVALESRSPRGKVELACAPPRRRDGQHSVSARVVGAEGAWVELVAHRPAGEPRFSDEDVELLAGVASLLARKNSFSPVERSDRFARTRSETSTF